MKKHIISFLTLVCGLAAVSCSNDAVENPEKPAGAPSKWTLGAGTGATRAAIGSSSEGFRPVNWQTGDLLTVFNAGTEVEFGLTSGASTTNGVFNSESEDIQNNTDYYAVHTAVPAVFTEGDGITLTMPSPMVVSGTMDEFVSGNLVLVSNKFKFSNQSAGGITMSMTNAVLELRLKLGAGQAAKSISSLEMVAPADDYFVASAAFDGAGGVDYTTAGTLKVSFSTPLNLSAEAEAVVKLVVWMNPEMTAADVESKNFVFNFLDSDGNRSVVLNKPAVLLEGGKYYFTPSQTPAPRKVVFVKVDGSGSGDGTSWNNAMSQTDLGKKLYANQIDAGNTICMAAGTYDKINSQNDGETGEFRILRSIIVQGGYPADITGDDIDITYPSAHKTIISGANARRSLTVRNNTTVTLKGLDITGGKLTQFAGAGFSVEVNSTTNMHYCKIYGNVNDGGGNGGGVYVQAGSTLNCENTEITGNTAAKHCGGLLVDGDNALATLKNCKVDGNISTGGWGGGFFVTKGKAVFENTEISGNSTTGTDTRGGAALISNGATVEMKQCVVKNNTAKAQAGAFMIETATVYFSHTEMTGNKAGSRGGAIQMANSSGFATGADVYLESCYLSGNQVGQFGSAIHVLNAASLLYMANTTITGNIGTDTCGALNFSNSSNPRVLISCTIAENIQTGGADQGIDIRCEAPNLSLINSVVTNSAADKFSLFISGTNTAASGGGNVIGRLSGTLSTVASDNSGITYAQMFGTNTAADNGGETPTILPVGTYPGASVADIQAFAASKLASPAYTFDFTKDQRGTARGAAAATPGACEK